MYVGKLNFMGFFVCFLVFLKYVFKNKMNIILTILYKSILLIYLYKFKYPLNNYLQKEFSNLNVKASRMGMSLFKHLV